MNSLSGKKNEIAVMDKILVLGATGVIGDAVLKYCSKHHRPAIGISRRTNLEPLEHLRRIPVSNTSPEAPPQMRALAENMPGSDAKSAACHSLAVANQPICNTYDTVSELK